MPKKESPDPASPHVPPIPVGVRGEPGKRGISRKNRNGRLDKPAARLLRVGGRLTKVRGSFFGIDLLLAEAESAKASLYFLFGSKDGLLAKICEAELAAFKRLLAGLDAFAKKPAIAMEQFADEFLIALGSPDSLIGVSMALLLSRPGDPAINDLPEATRSAAWTLMKFPVCLHELACDQLTWKVSDNFEDAARDYFKAALLAALTPKLFPNERPDKQPALLQAIESLKAQITVLAPAAGSEARVYVPK